MRLAALLLVLSTSTTAAMTSEDCRNARQAVLNVLPAASAFTVMPGVSGDGWCRTKTAPLDELAGLEWIATETETGFDVQARQADVDVPDFGPFAAFLSASHDATARTLKLTNLELRRRDGDAARVSLQLSNVDVSSNGAFMSEMAGAKASGLTVSISGQSGLVGEALAALFDLDRRAAASNFTVARDQRDVMMKAMDDWPAGLGDAAARAEFIRMIQAYPNARGTAEFTIPDGSDMALGPLMGFLLVGRDAREAAVLTALAEAGLSFRWRD
jgi:hypothetical protein